jgi:hypothetical protein
MFSSRTLSTINPFVSSIITTTDNDFEFRNNHFSHRKRDDILIVDDEPFNQLALENLLNTFFDFRISKASGGHQAIEMWN